MKADSARKVKTTGRQDPLMPFPEEPNGPASASKQETTPPWTNTTPQGRLPLPRAELPEKVEKEDKEQEAEKIRKQVDILKEALGAQLSDEVKQALDKAAQQANGPQLRHAHITRVERTRKAYATAKETVQKMDKEWQEFIDLLMKRFNSQMKAYSTHRSQAFEVMMEKKKLWEEAKSAIQQAVTEARAEQEEPLMTTAEAMKEVEEAQKKWDQLIAQTPINVDEEEDEMLDEEEEQAEIERSAEAAPFKTRKKEKGKECK